MVGPAVGKATDGSNEDDRGNVDVVVNDVSELKVATEAIAWPSKLEEVLEDDDDDMSGEVTGDNLSNGDEASNDKGNGDVSIDACALDWGAEASNNRSRARLDEVNKLLERMLVDLGKAVELPCR